MCPAGFELQPDMGIAAVLPEYLIMRDSFLGILIRHTHFHTVDRVSADGSIHRAGGFLEYTNSNSFSIRSISITQDLDIKVPSEAPPEKRHSWNTGAEPRSLCFNSLLDTSDAL